MIELQEGHLTCIKAVPLMPRSSVLEQVEQGDPTGQPADPGLPGKMAVKCKHWW